MTGWRRQAAMAAERNQWLGSGVSANIESGGGSALMNKRQRGENNLAAESIQRKWRGAWQRSGIIANGMA